MKMQTDICAEEILSQPLMCLRIKLIEAFKNNKLTLDLYNQILDDTVKLLPDARYTAYGDLYEHFTLAQTALRSGYVVRRPSLFHPVAQFIWGATLAVIASNPSVMDEWPSQNKPYGTLINSKLWEQLKETDKAKEEMIGYCLMLLTYFKVGKDVKIRWGGASYPDMGYYYNMDESLINVDLLWTLINGFEHSRCIVCHEIGHAYGTFGFTPKIEALNKQILELENQPFLSQENTNILTDKRVESYLRYLFFQESENSFANGFPKKLAENKLHYQDFAHSLNVIETLSDVGSLILRKNFSNDDFSEKPLQNTVPTATGQFIKTCELMRYAFYLNNDIALDIYEFFKLIDFPIEWIGGKDEKGVTQSPKETVQSFMEFSKELENMNIPLDSTFLKRFEDPDGRLQNQKILAALWLERARLSDAFFDRYIAHLLPEIKLELDKKLEEQAKQFADNANESSPEQTDTQSSSNEKYQSKDNQDTRLDADNEYGRKDDMDDEAALQNEEDVKADKSGNNNNNHDKNSEKGNSDNETQSLCKKQPLKGQNEISSRPKTNEPDNSSAYANGSSQPVQVDLERDISKECQKTIQDIESQKNQLVKNKTIGEELLPSRTFNPNHYNRLVVREKQVDDADAGHSIINLYAAPSNIKHVVDLKKGRGLIESQKYDPQRRQKTNEIHHGSFQTPSVKFQLPHFVKDHTVYRAIVAKYPDLAMTLKRFFSQMRNSYQEKETIFVKEIFPHTDIGQSLNIDSILDRKVKIATHQLIGFDDFRHFNNPYKKYYIKHAPIDICVFIDTSGSMFKADAHRFAVEVGSIIYEVTRNNEDYNVYVATMTDPVQFVAMPPPRKSNLSARNDIQSMTVLSDLHETLWVSDDKIANGILTTLSEIKSRPTVYEKEGLTHFFFITDGYHTDAEISMPLVKKMLFMPSCATFNWILVGYTPDLKGMSPSYGFTNHPVLTLYDGVKNYNGTQTIRVEGVKNTAGIIPAFTRLLQERVRELRNYKAIDTLKKKKMLDCMLAQTKVKTR